MQFNPIRQLFKYDGKVTIHINHVVNPTVEYGKVSLSDKYKVFATMTFAEDHVMMDRLMDEIAHDLQAFANRWKWFYSPEALVRLYVKTKRLLGNPER